ncbi:hypothetical protein KSS87_005954, partial [Heliosperma pusillum]
MCKILPGHLRLQLLCIAGQAWWFTAVTWTTMALVRYSGGLKALLELDHFHHHAA